MLHKGLIVSILIGFFGVASGLRASEVASFADPAPLYSVYGYDRPALPHKKSRFTLSVLPYYQYAKYSKNEASAKGSLGNRLGQINMLGLFLGSGPSTFTNPFTGSAETGDNVLNVAYTDLYNYAHTNTQYQIFVGNTYNPVEPTDARYCWGKYDAASNYSRIGARGCAEFCFNNGIALTVMGGVAEYSVKSPIYVANPAATTDAGGNPVFVNVATTTGSFAQTDTFLQGHLQPDLMALGIQSQVGTLLGYSFGGYRKNGVEDTTVELSWRRGFGLKDSEGDVVVMAIPLVAVGATLPTAPSRTKGLFFDIPLGNEGMYGFTGRLEASFDFPGMMKVGVGFVGTLYSESDLGEQFAPTSIYQSGIYPWQITVTKRPGALWKAYVMTRAEHFLDFLSCYATYTYVSHEADSITMAGALVSDFLPTKLENDGAFNAQLIHVGLEYEVTQALRFGAAIEAVFGGAKIWKTTTLAASLTYMY